MWKIVDYYVVLILWSAERTMTLFKRSSSPFFSEKERKALCAMMTVKTMRKAASRPGFMVEISASQASEVALAPIVTLIDRSMSLTAIVSLEGD